MSATAPGSDSHAVNQDIQEILAEVRALHRRMDTLNTRLFGNPEGDAGDEGRLVVLERRMNNHAGPISKLEGFRWWLLGGLVVADAIQHMPENVPPCVAGHPVTLPFPAGSALH